MHDHSFEHRGNKADYVLGSIQDDWKGFEVVRFRAVEELSRPFAYDILLRRRAGDGTADIDAMLDTGASLRVATEKRWRVVHGVIAEAEEVDRTDMLFYYRVLLVPPIVRAMHRRRCRTFVNQTLKDILTFVLENRSQDHASGLNGLALLSGSLAAPEAMPDFNSFKEPRGEYSWKVSDEARITDANLYRFVVQYNESDFNFISRLLEAEGISYYFEHTRDAVVMVLTDAPGQSPLFDDDKTLTLRGIAKGGSSGEQEVVRGIKDARRARSRAVGMLDYDWKRSNQIFTARRAADDADPDFSGYHEFPAKDDQLDEKVGDFPAKIRLERFETERSLREGRSTVRTIEPGHQVKLHSGDGLRDDEDLLLVRVESMATQHDVAGSDLENEHFGLGPAQQALGAYENKFTALAAAIPFRPAMDTRKPRIHGVQIARITCEEVSEVDIHADDQGNVRVRFMWDQRKPEPNTPSSDWVRVSHYWAGSSYGAQHIPRVGHEVLVAFLQGDPDRPVIVGRVYNPQSPAPYPPSAGAKAKTQTAWKSASSSITSREDGWNEIRFTDYKGDEEVYLQAEKNFNELVKNSHSTSVGGDQSNSVGHNQSNSVDADRTHDVKGTESVHVVGDRTTTFDANETHTVAGFLTTAIGANEKHSVGAFRNTGIGANEDITIGGFRNSKVGANDGLTVGGWRNTSVGAGENRTVTGPDNISVSADRRITVGGNHFTTANANFEVNSTNTYLRPSGDFQCNSTTAGFNQSGSFYVNVNGCTISMSAGKLVLDNGAGSSISLVGGTIVIKSGGAMTLKAGGTMNGEAPLIKLN